MENETPISIKNILIVSEIENKNKQFQLEQLIQITKPDLIISANNDFYKGSIPYYCNFKNNYLNIENKIEIFNYESQKEFKENSIQNKFSICLFKDVELNGEEKWVYKFKKPVNICILGGNKAKTLLENKNFFSFEESGMQFLIPSQNENFQQLFYIYLRVEFFQKHIEYQIHHPFDWMFYYLQNIQ